MKSSAVAWCRVFAEPQGEIWIPSRVGVGVFGWSFGCHELRFIAHIVAVKRSGLRKL